MFSWLAVVIVLIGLIPTQASAEAALPYLELTRPDRGKVFAVAWSPDGQYAAVGTEQGLWVYTDTFADVLHVADQPIHALAWSPDGRVIATGYFGKQAKTEAPRAQASDPPTYLMQGGGLRLWSVKKTDQQLTLTLRATLLKDGSVYALRFSPDSSSLASLSQDVYLNYDVGGARDELRLYATGSGKLLQQFDSVTSLLQGETITQRANGLAWSHDGRYLATIDTFGEGENRYFSIWDTVHEQFAVTLGLDECKPGTGNVTAVDWSDGDAQLAFSGVYWGPGSEGGVRVGYWGKQPAACQDPLLGDSQDGYSSGDIFTLAWQPGSQRLAYTTGTAIELWDATTKKPVAELDAARDDVTMLAWNADGSKLLAAGSDYAVRIWTRFDMYQLPDPQPTRETTLPVGYSGGALSPDGQWIAAVNQTSGLVEVIDVVNGDVRRSFDTRVDQPLTQIKDRNVPWSTADSWSPDNSMLAIWLSSDSRSLDCDSLPRNTVQLWSVQTGKLIRSWDGITSLAWMPDSQAVAVGIMKAYETHDVLSGVKYLVEADSFEVRNVQTGQVIEQAPPGEQWGEVLSPSRYPDMDPSDTFYFYYEHLLSVSRWSPDGRLLGIDDRVGCGVWGNTSALLWDTQSHMIAAQLDARRRYLWDGSGDSAKIRAWSPDGNSVLVQGLDQVFFYHLHWQEDRVTPELIWRRPGGVGPNEIVFSPNSRHFLYDATVWDMASGWPVFRFHGPMDDDTYRWVGDTLTGYDFGFAGDSTPGKVVSWHVSDFLPKWVR
jgi:WD40 repeat protein